MASERPALRCRALRQSTQIDKRCPRPAAFHEVKNQVDRFELRVGNVEAGGVAEKIKDAAAFDGVFHGSADGGEKPGEGPTAGAERPDVADGAHGNFDQPTGVAEGLGLPLRGDD